MMTIQWCETGGIYYLIERQSVEPSGEQIAFFARVTPPDPEMSSRFKETADAWGWDLLNSPLAAASEYGLASSGLVHDGGREAAFEAVEVAFRAVHQEAEKASDESTALAMTDEYVALSEAVACDIDEGHKHDPVEFMRSSRVRSAMVVIANANVTPEEAQEMYGVEFTDEELDQARSIQADDDCVRRGPGV